MPDKPKKILIVEDEKPMAHALELKLNNSGFQAKAVFNGEEALKILEAEQFSLMLLDLVMPQVDGFQVLEELKKRNNTTPIIVSTNLSQEEDQKRATDLGAKDFFVKSDTPISQVIEHIKKVLAQA
jgi:DNA-binding response OmpR family regulator